MPTEFEPRVGPSLWIQTPCNECNCPPSRVRWVVPPCAGTIAGTVSDERTGDPLENIALWVQNFETGSYGEAVTNEQGHYRIGNLEAGEGYVLTASGPGYSYRLLEDIVLSEEGLVQNVGMVRLGAARGTIRNNDGQPIEGATVYFTQQDDPYWGGGETTTDAEGHFCFCDVNVSTSDNLNGSNYEILALHPDYSFIKTTRLIAACYYRSDEVALNGVMPERATIEGVVLSDGAPLPDAVVGLNEDTNGLLFDAPASVTDALGNFSLRVNAPATYQLFAEGAQTSVTETTIDVTPNEMFFQVLEVLPPGSISGAVLHSDGAPVEDALVEILAQADDAGSLVEPTVSGADGSYSFPQVPPTGGEDGYIVRASVLESEEVSLFAEVEGVTVAPSDNTIIYLQGTDSNS